MSGLRSPGHSTTPQHLSKQANAAVKKCKEFNLDWEGTKENKLRWYPQLALHNSLVCDPTQNFPTPSHNFIWNLPLPKVFPWSLLTRNLPSRHLRELASSLQPPPNTATVPYKTFPKPSGTFPQPGTIWNPATKPPPKPGTSTKPTQEPPQILRLAEAP